MATATSQGAADQGLNVNAKNQPVVNSPDSVNLGGSKGSKFLASNSQDLSGAIISDNRNSGFQIGRNARVGDLNVTYAGSDNSDLYDALLSGQSQTQSLFSSILDKVTEQVNKVGQADTSGTTALTNLPEPAKKWNWPVIGAVVGGGLLLWYLWKKFA